MNAHKKVCMPRSSGSHGGVERFLKSLVGNVRERAHMEDLDVVGRIILKWIFKKLNRRA